MASNKKKELSGATLPNSRGTEIPIEIVRPDHLFKHNTVQKVLDEAFDVECKLIKTKRKILKLIQQYQKYFSKINKSEESNFDNITLSNYPNTQRVVIKSATVITFDEHLQLAEQKIKACMKKWGKDAHPYIQAVIEKVFKVDKKGFVDKASILGLFQYNITDKDWKEAMEFINKSIQEVDKKQYMVIQYRPDNKSEWKTLNLNLSSIDVESVS